MDFQIKKVNLDERSKSSHRDKKSKKRRDRSGSRDRHRDSRRRSKSKSRDRDSRKKKRRRSRSRSSSTPPKRRTRESAFSKLSHYETLPDRDSSYERSSRYDDDRPSRYDDDRERSSKYDDRRSNRHETRSPVPQYDEFPSNVVPTIPSTDGVLNYNNGSVLGVGTADPQHNMSEAEAREQRRKSRWSSNKAFVPGMPTILPSDLDDTQTQIYLCKHRIYVLVLNVLFSNN